MEHSSRMTRPSLHVKRWAASKLRRALRTELGQLATRSEAEQLAHVAYQQAECYVQLHRQLPDLRVTGLRQWAISPDACLALVNLIESHQPKLIVELGSGVSTIVLATALQRWVPQGRVISVDHSPRYAESTRSLLGENALTNAEVRTSPLEPFAGADHPSQPWYRMDSFDDIHGIDLLFIDGPPAQVGPNARDPSFNALAHRMSDKSWVVLDDTRRSDESSLAKRWAIGKSASRDDIETEKGLAVIAIDADSPQVGNKPGRRVGAGDGDSAIGV